MYLIKYKQLQRLAYHLISIPNRQRTFGNFVLYSRVNILTMALAIFRKYGTATQKIQNLCNNYKKQRFNLDHRINKKYIHVLPIPLS